MSKQIVNIGSSPNDGTGDSIRVGMNKINLNFNEIYSALGDGTTASDIGIVNASASGNGSIGYANRTLTFTPPDLSGYLTGIGTISEHTDVQVSNPQVGEVLKWDGANWVNGTDSTGTGGTGGIEGVLFQDNTSNVGTAAILNFGTNLSATIGSGIVTVNATDTNTTYSQSAVVSGSNVNLRLSGSDTVNDDILVTAGTNISISDVTADGFTVNSSAYSRTTANVTTTSIGVGNTAELTITAAKTYVLYSVQTSHPAWVTLYVDAASRTDDASRLETQDPLPGSGVVAEVITTSGNLTQLITPGTVGFNNDETPSDNVYARVVNKHSTPTGIGVTLKYLKLED